MSLKQILFIKIFKICALHSISDIFSVNIFYYHMQHTYNPRAAQTDFIFLVAL